MPSTITAGTTSGTSLNFSGDTSGVLTVQGVTMGNGGVGNGNATRFKNRIINGDMRIDQRNAGASVTPTTNATYTLDRWRMGLSQSSKFSVQQNAGSVTPPNGFTNYLGITSLSAYTVGASEFFQFSQTIEGLNVADLGWGTANAKTVTLSFQVYSSLTGTFGGAFANNAGDRSYPFSYTISSANTWTQINVTVAGDTSGTWLKNNSGGIWLYFGLGVGSTYSGTAGSWAAADYRSATGATSVIGTNGATFYVTGVQLEVGSTASAFEVVDYTTELQLCQRYYYRQSGASAYGRFGTGFSNSTTNLFATVNFPVAMRAKPTSIVWTGNLGVWAGGTIFSVSAVSLESGSEMTTSAVAAATTSGISGTTAYALIGNNSSTASLAFNAEL
jgi:hypothetical protein